MVLGTCQWLFWRTNVNPVRASSAFCGFSFAEDNQYRLDLSETKSVSRIKRVFHGLGITAAKDGIQKWSPKLYIWMSVSFCTPWLLTTELERYFPLRNVIFVSFIVHWSRELTHFGAQTPLNSQCTKTWLFFFLWDLFTDDFTFLWLNVNLETCTRFLREQMWYVYICF